VVLAHNAGSGLLGLCGEAAAAARTLPDHLGTLLPGGDAVSVAFEDFLGNPPHDGCGILATLEPFDELLFELLDVGHVRCIG